MGQQLSSLSTRLSKELSSVLDESPRYRHQLKQLLSQYQADRSLSEQQILQWSGEKLVADATNQHHEIGARFLPRLESVELGSFDAHQVTQCIAQAAMQYLEELRLDMNFHVRLLDCAAKGSVDKLRKIQPFVELNYQNEAGSTALMIACHENQRSMVEYLLSQHVNANLQDQLGWTALMFCARDGHEELVEMLLSEEYDTDIDLTALNGINALMCAADAGHFKIAQLLVERGADVNACTNAGDTALLHSCHGGHSNIVRLLLSASADVNVTGKHLCSPALLAARFGYYEILSQLIQAGADVAAQDDEGRTICDFEFEGQVAASIQRGIVARFNKSIIKPAFPSMIAGGGSTTWNGMRNPSRTQASTESSRATSTGSSPMPNGYHHGHHPASLASATPHPRKTTQGSIVSTVSDSPSSTSSATAHQANHPSSRSRTPSPTTVPVRARKGSAATASTSSASASHATRTQRSGSAAASSSSASSAAAIAALAHGLSSNQHASGRGSKTFSHPRLADALTDAALAELEAGVENILQRRTGAVMHDPSSARDDSDQPPPNPPQRTNSIIKHARIDSPLDAAARRRNGLPSASPEQLFVPSVRGSDNVHQYEGDGSVSGAEGDRRRSGGHLDDSGGSSDERSHSDTDDASSHHQRSSLRNPRPRRSSDLRVAADPDRPHDYMALLDAHLLAARSPATGDPTPSPRPNDSSSEEHTRDQSLAAEGSDVSQITPPASDSVGAGTTTAGGPSSSPPSEPATSPVRDGLSAPGDASAPNELQSPPEVTPPPPHILALRTALAEAVAEVVDASRDASSADAEVKVEGKSESIASRDPSLPVPSSSVIPEPSPAAAASDGASSSRDASPSGPRRIQKRRARKSKAQPVEIGLAPTAPIGIPHTIGKKLGPMLPVAGVQGAAVQPVHASQSVYTPAGQPVAAASASPIAAPSSSPPVVPVSNSSGTRQIQERAVDAWLISCGFDTISRSALAGFTFQDLQSLDLNDCVEILGEASGPMLFGLLRKRARDGAMNGSAPASALVKDSPLPAAANAAPPVALPVALVPTPSVEPAVSPVVPHPPSTWAEAAVAGMIAEIRHEQDLERETHQASATQSRAASTERSLSISSATEEEDDGPRFRNYSFRAHSTPTAVVTQKPTPSPSSAVSIVSPAAVPSAISTSATTSFASPTNSSKPSPIPSSPRSARSALLASGRGDPFSSIPQSRSNSQPVAVATRPTVSTAIPVFRGSAASVHAVSQVISSGRLTQVVDPPPLVPPPSLTPTRGASPSVNATTTPTSTGYWTRDAIASLKDTSWLTASIESVKNRVVNKIAGKDLQREAMRAAQPHRTRRTDKDANGNVANAQAATSAPAKVSAWDALGRDLDSHPSSTRSTPLRPPTF